MARNLILVILALFDDRIDDRIYKSFIDLWVIEPISSIEIFRIFVRLQIHKV